MIKLDIINRLAERTGIPKLKAEQAVDALFHSMKEALARGDRIELRGFGVFIVKPRKRGVGRNPRTGEEVAIPNQCDLDAFDIARRLLCLGKKLQKLRVVNDGEWRRKCAAM